MRTKRRVGEFHWSLGWKLSLCLYVLTRSREFSLTISRVTSLPIEQSKVQSEVLSADCGERHIFHLSLIAKRFRCIAHTIRPSRATLSLKAREAQETGKGSANDCQVAEESSETCQTRSSNASKLVGFSNRFWLRCFATPLPSEYYITLKSGEMSCHSLLCQAAMTWKACRKKHLLPSLEAMLRLLSTAWILLLYDRNFMILNMASHCASNSSCARKPH